MLFHQILQLNRQSKSSKAFLIKPAKINKCGFEDKNIFNSYGIAFPCLTKKATNPQEHQNPQKNKFIWSVKAILMTIVSQI